MTDNFPLTPGTGRNAATDQVTYSGDTADVQLVRSVVVTGAEGSKTVVDIDTNSGNKSAGTPRVVIATDQPALSTPMPVSGTVTASGVAGDVAHGASNSGNPVQVGIEAIAHGTNPAAVTAGQRTKLYANRAGIPFMIGGHPNPVMYGMSITTGVSNTIIGPTINTGTKLVVTSLTVVLDNASTVFPSVVIGFGTASTPAFATTPGTSKVIAGHPAVPAGGGFTRGDGSGIIGVGADDEELRITTVGTAGGNGLYVLLTGYTIES